MEHCGYVTQINNLRPHSNADRLQLTDIFGNTVCVDLNIKIGDTGVYFPTDLQLSEEFCEKNDLVRRKGPNGENLGGYLEPGKRNIRAMNLRGEKSDGLFLPMSCLDYCFGNGAIGYMNIGDTITVVNGHEICQKYIPKGKKSGATVATGNKTRKKKEPIAPLFVEHADTEQLAYNLSAFKAGDQIEITLKMHGTSQRTGYLPMFKGYKRTLKDKILRREGTPVYDYGYVTGTRRTVLDNFDGGFYGSNEFREQHAEVFYNKLWKGETVYYEVVGFTHTGTPIMSTADNGKLGKDFVKQYGKTTTFSYGCAADGHKIMHGTDEYGDFQLSVSHPQSDCYVYRMTMTNEDGQVVEYTPDFMRYRCEQMGVKTVPVFWKGYIPDCAYASPADEDREAGYLNGGEISLGEYVKNIAEKFYDGTDPIGKTHVREGVVVRIINRPKFTAYKHKNFSFKVLSGIALEKVSDSDAAIDADILAEM